MYTPCKIGILIEFLTTQTLGEIMTVTKQINPRNKTWQRSVIGLLILFILIFTSLILIPATTAKAQDGASSSGFKVEIEGSYDNKTEKTLYWDQEAVFEITLENNQGSQQIYLVEYTKPPKYWNVTFRDIDKDEITEISKSGLTKLNITLASNSEINFDIIISSPIEPTDD